MKTFIEYSKYVRVLRPSWKKYVQREMVGRMLKITIEDNHTSIVL